MDPRSGQKRAGIKQIASALGISIGTVDRALHGRDGISAETRARVLQMAHTLNYSPNVVARTLKLNRQFRIGMFLPEQIACFFDPLREGVRSAARSMVGASVDAVFHTFPRLRAGDVEALETEDWRQYDGILLAPGDPRRLAPICHAAEKTDKPLVFVATDADGAHRLSSVAVEASASGGIAAELLGQVLSEPQPVAVITGDRKIQDHAEKLRGFSATLARLAPHLTLLPAVESHESAVAAHRAALRLIEEYPRLGGLYISTANSLPVMRALKAKGRLGKIKVIATDLFPEMAQWIESGAVFATLHQRPFTQGRMAFELLGRYLTSGVTPDSSIRLAPHIVLRSNLSLFQRAVEVEETMPVRGR